jgi:hypothetical protein
MPEHADLSAREQVACQLELGYARPRWSSGLAADLNEVVSA